MARISARPATRRLRDRLILTYAPLVKYVAGRLGCGPAGPRGRGRPRLLRPARPDRRDRALRARPRREVRDVRDRPDQGRDHRRAALHGLGAALGALARARHRARDRRARGASRPRADRRGDLEEARHHRGGARGRASPRSPAPRSRRSTSSGRSRLGAATRSRSSTRSRTRRAPDPQGTLSVTEQKEALAEAVARLPEREKLVVTLYYYEELTLREIGEVLGVTESRVSQLHTKAILRLKAHIASAGAHAAL